MAEVPAPHDPPVVMTSADNTVRVALRPDGLIESVTLDPRVKRLPIDDLGQAITATLTAAQQELLRRATTRDPEAAQQVEKRLSADFEEINDEYLRQTAIYEATAMEIIKRMDK